MKNTNGTIDPRRWVWELTGGDRFRILLLIVFQAIMGGTGVATALFFRNLIDSAVSGDKDGFIMAAVCSISIIIITVGVTIFSSVIREKAVTSLENRMKSRLLQMMLRKEYASVTAIHSGEWMNRMTSDTSVVSGAVVGLLPGVTGLVVRLAGAIIAMIALEPLFVAILIPSGLVVMGFNLLLRKPMKHLHKEVQEENGKVRIFLLERIESMLVVRLFGAEKQTRQQADEKMKQWQKVRMKRNAFSVVCNIGLYIVFNGAYVLGAIFCGWRLLNHLMTYGTLMAVLQLINQIQSPLAGLSGIMPQYFSMIASAERLSEIEKYPDEIAEDESRCSFSKIEAHNLDFTYPDDRETSAFSGVSLEVNRGEFVAFTGESGCGKSSILKLIMGLYMPDGGELLIDGEKLTSAWRGLFSYVPQGNFLMSGTIRDIVSLGRKDSEKDDAAIREALRLACADFIDELEDGLDTNLGERGRGLSEGQMQRIAIARALYAKRPILLLDEATSALDGDTEVRLLENLRTMKDRTVILVTHRPAALAVCDREVRFGA